MRILITVHHLCERSGTEMFTKQLALLLKDNGHEVHVFTLHLGEVAEEMRAAGIEVTDSVSDFACHRYDLIHVQHNTTVIPVRTLFPDTPLLIMVHGVIPEKEQLLEMELGVSMYIAVSEEVADYLVERFDVHRTNIAIVRNFVDTAVFYPREPLREKPKRLLVISNHFKPHVRRAIDKACEVAGIQMVHVGRPENPVEHVEEHINEADIVVSLGRGVLESIACGRHVIVYDMHGGDGMVLPENFEELRYCNFSGRCHARRYSAEDFSEQLRLYDPVQAEQLREKVLEEHAPESFYGLLMQVYKDAVANPIPYGRMKFLACYNAYLKKQLEIKDDELQQLQENLSVRFNKMLYRLRRSVSKRVRGHIEKG